MLATIGNLSLGIPAPLWKGSRIATDRSPGRRDPGKLAYDLTFRPAGTSLVELAGPDGYQVAGLRRTVEECFQRAKDVLGLDRREARSWHGWHRHIPCI